MGSSPRLTVGAAAVVAAVVVFTLVLLPPAPARVAVTLPANPRVVAGALHVHTIRSDGSGTVEEVAAAAHAAGLQFVLFADHGDGRRVEPPAYRSGVLCIDGAEISTEDGHLVAAGFRAAPYRLAGEGRDVIADIHRLGGLAYVAHPTSPRPALAWHGWDAPFDGFEWLNADSEWRRQSAWALGRMLAGYFTRPGAALARSFVRPATALDAYDRLARGRWMLAIAGHDAHARIGPEREEGGAGRVRLPLPSYRASFQTFATRVELEAPPTGDATRDAASLLHALRHGHAYTAIDGLAAPADFAFSATSGRATAGAGDRLIPAGPVTFVAQADAPAGAVIVLLQDGREVVHGIPPRLSATMPASAGEYRVEVRLADGASGIPMPWIASNPVYIGIGDARAQDRESVRPVREVPASFSPTGWRVEHEPSSTGAVVAGEAGEAELSYSLGSNPASSPYAAAVYDLKIPDGALGISFTVTAAQPMRFSCQLRAPEPDPGAAGIRWRRSVFADTDDRRVSILWADMRRVGAGDPARPNLGTVTSVMLVVDSVNTDPGASGRLTVRDPQWVYTAEPGVAVQEH